MFRVEGVLDFISQGQIVPNGLGGGGVVGKVNHQLGIRTDGRQGKQRLGRRSGFQAKSLKRLHEFCSGDQRSRVQQQKLLGKPLGIQRQAQYALGCGHFLELAGAAKIGVEGGVCHRISRRKLVLGGVRTVRNQGVQEGLHHDADGGYRIAVALGDRQEQKDRICPGIVSKTRIDAAQSNLGNAVSVHAAKSGVGKTSNRQNPGIGSQ